MKQKLANAKRVPASTALLDDDNVIMAPPLREDLKHQQVKEDKQAVAVRLAEVTKQLAEAEEDLKTDMAELVDLQKERARLIVDKKPVKEISDQIIQLEQSIEQTPAVIACLRERFGDLQNEQRQIERDTNLSLQKEAAHLQERLSKQLVELLGKALETNTVLQSCERNYIRLRELTGVDIVSSKVCQGSHGSLQALYETCQQELEGQRGVRPPMAVGRIPI